MANLSTLIERVEALTGPDREVDLDIAIATGMVSDEVFKYGFYLWRIEARRVDPYTASIDAAVALVEQVLPGWAKGFDAGPKTHIAFVDPHDHDDRMFGARHTARGQTPAIALVLAALRALHAQEGRDG